MTFQDFGFGREISRYTGGRLLDSNGQFRVRRQGAGFFKSRALYHRYLQISWPKFLISFVIGYLILNIVFATLYILAGYENLHGATRGDPLEEICEAFFFRVQTFSTIGYGRIAPVGIKTNLVVTLESVVGSLWLALATGLVFARFSRPSARIKFSTNALIAPYQDITAFMFRIVNVRSTELINLQVELLVALYDLNDQSHVPTYRILSLERDQVRFFPTTWTIVHPIDRNSPLWGMNSADLIAHRAEFLIAIKTFDEMSSQAVHVRTSYIAREVIWNARFRRIFEHAEDGSASLDIRRLDEIDLVANQYLFGAVLFKSELSELTII